MIHIFIDYKLMYFVLKNKQIVGFLIGSAKLRSKYILSLSIGFSDAEIIPVMKKKREDMRNASNKKVCCSSMINGVKPRGVYKREEGDFV